jgi:hypothetical protein
MSETLNPKIPIHLLTHPPQDLSLIEEYKKVGVTSIAFNLEVFDPDVFKKICPGNDRDYGYDNWIIALEEARTVFGDYKAFCGLVWGLEPIESTIEGNEFILKNKFGLASNIFHSDPRSLLSKHPHLTENEIKEIALEQSKLYEQYPQAKTIFPTSMRSTIDWEIYRGDMR